MILDWREEKLIVRYMPGLSVSATFLAQDSVTKYKKEQYIRGCQLEYYKSNLRTGHFLPEDFRSAIAGHNPDVTYCGFIHGILIKGREYAKNGWADLAERLGNLDEEMKNQYIVMKQEMKSEEKNIFFIKKIMTKPFIKDNIIQRMLEELPYTLMEHMLNEVDAICIGKDARLLDADARNIMERIEANE